MWFNGVFGCDFGLQELALLDDVSDRKHAAVDVEAKKLQRRWMALTQRSSCARGYLDCVVHTVFGRASRSSVDWSSHSWDVLKYGIVVVMMLRRGI